MCVLICIFRAVCFIGKNIYLRRRIKEGLKFQKERVSTRKQGMLKYRAKDLGREWKSNCPKISRRWQIKGRLPTQSLEQNALWPLRLLTEKRLTGSLQVDRLFCIWMATKYPNAGHIKNCYLMVIVGNLPYHSVWWSSLLLQYGQLGLC